MIERLREHVSIVEVLEGEKRCCSCVTTSVYALLGLFVSDLMPIRHRIRLVRECNHSHPGARTCINHRVNLESEILGQNLTISARINTGCFIGSSNAELLLAHASPRLIDNSLLA